MTQCYSTVDNVTVVSIMGSFRDTLIDSSLGDISVLVAPEKGFSVLTTSIPGVWVSADHEVRAVLKYSRVSYSWLPLQCIVWCNQLARKLSSIVMLAGSVHATVEERTSLLRSQLLKYEPQTFSSLARLSYVCDL